MVIVHRVVHRCGKRAEQRNETPAYTTFSVENGESRFRRTQAATFKGADQRAGPPPTGVGASSSARERPRCGRAGCPGRRRWRAGQGVRGSQGRETARGEDRSRGGQPKRACAACAESGWVQDGFHSTRCVRRREYVALCPLCTVSTGACVRLQRGPREKRRRRSGRGSVSPIDGPRPDLYTSRPFVCAEHGCTHGCTLEWP